MRAPTLPQIAWTTAFHAWSGTQPPPSNKANVPGIAGSASSMFVYHSCSRMASRAYCAMNGRNSG
nr:hypothetical protein [Burkholderia ubonensis]